MKKISGIYAQSVDGKSQITLNSSNLIDEDKKTIYEIVNRVLSEPQVVKPGEEVDFRLRNFSLTSIIQTPMIVLSQRNGHNPFNREGIEEYARIHNHPSDDKYLRIGSPRDAGLCYLKTDRSFVEILLQPQTANV